MEQPPEIFDRTQVKRMRKRALKWGSDGQFLRIEVAQRVLERLSEINRRFKRALIIGVAEDMPWPADDVVSASSLHVMPNSALALDEEALPFQDESFDLIISILDLHWVNDLPGALIQFNKALKPDGLFLGALFCAGTLGRLKEAFLASESSLQGGASPHVAPFADIRDLGGLLQRAGFTMPVADIDWLDIRYRDTFALLADLRKMGETNALSARKRHVSTRAAFFTMAQHYEDRVRGDDDRISAEFAIGFLTGWAPGPGQPKPKRPGSASARLADALKVREEKL